MNSQSYFIESDNEINFNNLCKYWKLSNKKELYKQLNWKLFFLKMHFSIKIHSTMIFYKNELNNDFSIKFIRQ